MGQSYHTNEAVDGKVPEALSHRLVGALTPHSQCGVYDAKVYLRPEGTLQNMADNIERPIGTRPSLHYIPHTASVGLKHLTVRRKFYVLLHSVRNPFGTTIEVHRTSSSLGHE